MGTDVSTTREYLHGVVDKVVVFSPCSESKCDQVDIPAGFTPKNPSDYLESIALRDSLVKARQKVLDDPSVQKGNKSTLAFDLYVKAARSIAYKGIRESCYIDLRKKLLSSNDLQWFFLSGGYGVINALEKAQKYDASFYSPRIKRIWQEAKLSVICDSIVQKLSPSHIYVFGSPKYLDFLKEAAFYGEVMGSGAIKVFEALREPRDVYKGLRWLSEVLQKFAKAVVSNRLTGFDSEYPEKYYNSKKQAGTNNVY